MTNFTPCVVAEIVNPTAIAVTATAVTATVNTSAGRVGTGQPRTAQPYHRRPRRSRATVALSPTRPPVPLGVPGHWNLVYQDEFLGSSLDTSRWVALEGFNTNNVTTHASNVSVAGANGYCHLRLASSSSGAEIDSNPSDGAGSKGYQFAVGDVVEARILFPGSGTTINNWPAFWTSGPNWPAAGEIDIAEGLGTLTVNYHSPSGAHNLGTISGNWAGDFHVYSCHRMNTSFDVYYDGVLVKSRATDDNGAAHSVLANIGNGSGPAVYGTGSDIQIDYVRAWKPTP